jgi:hypothetical protein
VSDIFTEEDLFRLATAGSDVELFMSTPIGPHIMTIAEMEIQQGRDELEAAAPEDTPAIRAAQDKIRRVRLAVGWIQEIINQGQEAHLQLAPPDAEEDNG